MWTFTIFDTYQSQAALKLCNIKNCIYVMENRCMGFLEHLGNYKEINALYNLSGSSLIAQWINDAIVLTNHLAKDHNKNIVVAGISSGGLTSLIVSLFLKNIDKVICQGYLSNFQKSFLGTKSSINSLHFWLNIIFSISKFIKNQKVIFINGDKDHFDYRIAKEEFKKMKNLTLELIWSLFHLMD